MGLVTSSKQPEKPDMGVVRPERGHKNCCEKSSTDSTNAIACSHRRLFSTPCPRLKMCPDVPRPIAAIARQLANHIGSANKTVGSKLP